MIGASTLADLLLFLGPLGNQVGLAVALALATLLSEDLACVAAGVLAAGGAITLPAAVAACLAGIFAGDLLLYLAGRTLGRAAVARPPLAWLVSPAAVARAFRRYSRLALLSCFFKKNLVNSAA